MPLSPRFRSFLPWLAGVVLLALVLWRVPPSALQQSIALARLEVFVPLVAAACGAWFLIDALAFGLLFSRFNVDLPLRRALELRGLTYLLTPIHWNVGRIGVIARLHASHRVPLLEGTSSLAFYQTLDAILISSLCGLGISRLGGIGGQDSLDVWSTLAWIAATVALSLVTYLALIRSDRFEGPLLSRLRSSAFHRTHRMATAADIATILALRLAYYGVFLVVYAWGTSAFQIDLPVALIVASIPILQCVGALPISPAGFGTQQAAMLILFAGHGDEGAIVAFGLALPLLCILFRCLIGLPYLRSITTGVATRGTELEARRA